MAAVPLAWLITWLLRDPSPAFVRPEAFPRAGACAIGLAMPVLVAGVVEWKFYGRRLGTLVVGPALASGAALASVDYGAAPLIGSVAGLVAYLGGADLAVVKGGRLGAVLRWPLATLASVRLTVRRDTASPAKGSTCAQPEPARAPARAARC